MELWLAGIPMKKGPVLYIIWALDQHDATQQIHKAFKSHDIPIHLIPIKTIQEQAPAWIKDIQETGKIYSMPGWYTDEKETNHE